MDWLIFFFYCGLWKLQWCEDVFEGSGVTKSNKVCTEQSYTLAHNNCSFQFVVSSLSYRDVSLQKCRI